MTDPKGTITREIVVFKMRDALSDLSSLIGKAYPEYKAVSYYTSPSPRDS